jgi:hypothetical protein
MPRGGERVKRWAKVKWGKGKGKGGKRRQRNREEAREKGIPGVRMGNDRRDRERKKGIWKAEVG